MLELYERLSYWINYVDITSENKGGNCCPIVQPDGAVNSRLERYLSKLIHKGEIEEYSYRQMELTVLNLIQNRCTLVLFFSRSSIWHYT